MQDDAKKMKILIVDDEDDFRDSARQVLGRRGFEVVEAESGERALDLIDTETPDIVLLDLRMKGMDGIATLERMRQLDPHLPVIILTGHGGFDEAVAGIKLDIIDFVQKPVSMDRLAERIRRLLRQGDGGPLREKSIADLMVPADSYRRLYEDQTMEEALAALHDTLFQDVVGRASEKGHRSILVFDRSERFVGMVRVADVLSAALPSFLRQSPYASYFTGMFLAQSKLLGRIRVSELARELEEEKPVIDVNAPLMEAVHLMASKHVINLPVLKDGEIVGVLRDKDLLLEIARSVIGA